MQRDDNDKEEEERELKNRLKKIVHRSLIHSILVGAPSRCCLCVSIDVYMYVCFCGYMYVYMCMFMYVCVYVFRSVVVAHLPPLPVFSPCKPHLYMRLYTSQPPDILHVHTYS